MTESPDVPREVAVIGAGTMGAEIAAVFASGGAEVRLASRRQVTLDEARERLERVAPAAADRVRTTTSIDDALTDAGLVVETIAEELEPKVELLARAERLAAPAAVLVSNTSSLSLAAIGSRLERPGRFAGLHFFNPPELVELVEVVAAPETEPAVLERLVACMERLGKAPALVRRDVPGFVANRLQYALMREAYALVEAGVASLEDVDLILTRGLGVRWAAVGPFETMDLAGLEVHRAVVRNLFPALSNATEVPASLASLVEGGALGCRNGRGLRGAYDAAAVEALTERRARLLRGIPALRDGEETG